MVEDALKIQFLDIKTPPRGLLDSKGTEGAILL